MFHGVAGKGVKEGIINPALSLRGSDRSIGCALTCHETLVKSFTESTNPHSEVWRPFSKTNLLPLV